MKRHNTSSSSAPTKKAKLPVNLGLSEPNPCSTKQDVVQQLKKWFVDKKFHGINNLDFDISESCGNSLGCFAKKPFKSGDILFTVPADCMISIRHVNSSPAVQFLLSVAKEINKLEMITVEFCYWLFLVESKNEGSSPFHVYLQSLAEESPSILSWPSDLSNLLQDSNLASSLQSLRASLSTGVDLLEEIRGIEAHKLNANKLIPSAQFNSSSLLWAAGHYLSRRYPFYFASQDESSLPEPLGSLNRESGFGNLGTMVPCLDILNHNHSREFLSFEVTKESNASTDIHTGDLQVKSLVDVSPGGELFSNYGPISNGQLMFAYGYAIPNNPHDEFMLKVKLPQSFEFPSSTSSSSADSSTSMASRGLFALKRGGFHGIPKELFAVFKVMIRMSDPSEEDDDDASEENANMVVDEECLDLLYSYLSNKLLHLHGLYIHSVRDTLKDTYLVSFEVPFPGGVRYEDEEELGIPTILELRPCTVAALPLPRHHSQEELVQQQRGLCIAYYLAGQFEILLEIMKDLQNMMGTGEEQPNEDDGEEDEDEDDDA